MIPEGQRDGGNSKTGKERINARGGELLLAPGHCGANPPRALGEEPFEERRQNAPQHCTLHLSTAHPADRQEEGACILWVPRWKELTSGPSGFHDDSVRRERRVMLCQGDACVKPAVATGAGGTQSPDLVTLQAETRPAASPHRF